MPTLQSSGLQLPPKNDEGRCLRVGVPPQYPVTLGLPPGSAVGGSGRLLDSLFQPGEEEVHPLFHQARSLATEQIVLSMRGSVAKARHLRDIFDVLPSVDGSLVLLLECSACCSSRAPPQPVDPIPAAGLKSLTTLRLWPPRAS